MNAKLLVRGTLAGALTLFAWETISKTLIPWPAPDLTEKSALLGLMLGRQFALDLVVAFVVLMALLRFPRATAGQYAVGTAALALAVSASAFVSEWNWYGFGAAWTVVNAVDRVIGYGLLGLVLGAAINKWNGRVNTNEWSGVQAPTGLPSSMSAPKPRPSSRN
ncbi:MAG: hypothetical protein WD825_06230 [Gemmatimonadaceae bacterium]